MLKGTKANRLWSLPRLSSAGAQLQGPPLHWVLWALLELRSAVAWPRLGLQWTVSRWSKLTGQYWGHHALPASQQRRSFLSFLFIKSSLFLKIFTEGTIFLSFQRTHPTAEKISETIWSEAEMGPKITGNVFVPEFYLGIWFCFVL